MIPEIVRRKTRTVYVGKVPIGSDHPITVQTMTNTPTADGKATQAQIDRIVESGADIVRVSCPDYDSALALKELVKNTPIPIVADIHFNYKLAIEAAKAGVACLRINPGNIGNKEHVRQVVQAAKDHHCAMRIGVNAGSLEKQFLEKYPEPCAEAMVESALFHKRILEDNDFFNFKISVKASNYFLATTAYQQLAKACDYPLHVGITEAGTQRAGTVLSSMGIGLLLSMGIGDTIRVSLATDPVEEVKVGFDILKSLYLRHKGVRIIACPSCARQGFDVVKTVASIEEKLAHIQKPITISMLGCVVNGLGEAQHSNIGIVGIPANKENIIFIDGKRRHTVSNEQLEETVVHMVEDYVKDRS